VRARLRELEALERHLHDEAPARVASSGPVGREARRAALTRTIERLEGLQAAFRKG
jgi:hypothetical protein